MYPIEFPFREWNLGIRVMRRWKQLLCTYQLFRCRKQKKKRHFPQGKLLAKIAKEIDIPKKKCIFADEI